ncbi:hypothetical protein [Thaumasiovibrio subtropicus]|uniref:hypothetical protein n=1 Tax=Thaumasiovibrio subtropicus TaxID=1891207 RepID=UPI000B352253|nr:hypothetical protein [Thaumasiovibrio subtropicus]
MNKSACLRRGIKIYDDAWHTEHHFSAEALAVWLKEHGFTFVIHISSFLGRGASTKPDHPQFHDIELRSALSNQGIFYFLCMDFGNDLLETRSNPDLIAVDQYGDRQQQYDWYLGIVPNQSNHLSLKCEQLQNATLAIQPDGVHIGFIRWPGFWENWLANYSRSNMSDYSYDPVTLSRFQEDSDHDFDPYDAPRAFAYIQQHCKEEFVQWKCELVLASLTALVSSAKAVCGNVKTAINTLPFFQSDFNQAHREVFGQDIALLSLVVDVFEVMAYHQILDREASWPTRISEDIYSRALGNSEVISSTQLRPWYTQGLHAEHRRRHTLSVGEAIAAMDERWHSPISGRCIFNLTDLLRWQKATDEGKQFCYYLRS